MIEPMLRVTVLFVASDSDTVVRTLQRMGVLHLQRTGSHSSGETNSETGPGERGPTLSDRLDSVRQAYALALRAGPTAHARSATAAGHARTAGRKLGQARVLVAAQRLLSVAERREQLSARLQTLDADLRLLALLGNPELARAHEMGLRLEVFQGDPAIVAALLAKRADLLPAGVTAQSGLVVRVSRGPFDVHEAAAVPLEAVPLPKHSHQELESERAPLRLEIERTERALSQLSRFAASFASTAVQLADAIGREDALGELDQTDGIAQLVGYAPARRRRSLEQSARRHGWALYLSAPGENEPVPTLVHQSAIGRVFQQVMSFLGVTPGYREYDTNPVFFLFFTVFFALIVGDAGYGLSLLVVVGALSLFGRTRPGIKRVRTLFLTQGLAVFLWGAMTGVWFGLDGARLFRPLAFFVVAPFSAFTAGTRDNIIVLCLTLGVGHLSVAHLWALFRARGLRRLAEAGRLLLVLAGGAAALTLILGMLTISLAFLLAGTGLLFIVLFDNAGSDGFLKGALRGTASLPLKLLDTMSGFSDVVSYIRLFAVGLATQAVGAAFNDMAARSGFATFGSALVSVSVLVLGHSVNIALAAMGVLVHGVRLNLLEFSRHLNVSWGGIPYRPLRRTRRHDIFPSAPMTAQALGGK